jgi:hypothetical protein
MNQEDFERNEAVAEEQFIGNNEVQSDEVEQIPYAEIIERLRMEQKLTRGILAGLIVGIVGAILWGIITVATEYQIGYMAIAVGAGVGFAIRKFGKGVDPIFGYWGAGIALLSVFIGNFLSIIGFLANAEGLGYIETLWLFDYGYLFPIMKEAFQPIDVLFYGLALYEGYKFAIIKIEDSSQQPENQSIISRFLRKN